MGRLAQARAEFRSPAHVRHFARMVWWARRIAAWRDASTLPELFRRVEPRRRAPIDPDTTDRWLRFLFRRRATMPVNNCYTRSLLRYKFLREAGLGVRLLIGLRRNPDGDFAGHAWIVLDGQPYRESEDTNYTVTLAHPPEAAP